MTYAPPSNVPARHGDPTDVMGRRILAHIVDLVIVVVIAGLLFFATAQRTTGVPSDYCTAKVYQFERTYSCVNFGNTAYRTNGSTTLLLLAVVLGYWIVVGMVEGATGAFVGKRMAGLRVVRDDGARAGVGKGSLRGFLMLVDSMFCFLVGLSVASVSPPPRRIGDMAATTFVVSKESAGHRVAP